MTEDMFAQKGWICPKCGRVLAPSTMYCLWCCSDMKETITTTTTSTPYKVDTSSICKDEPKSYTTWASTDEPQTCEKCEHWSDTEDGCADRHGCTIDCAWK